MLSYASSSILRAFVEILKDMLSFNIHDVLIINLTFTIIGIVLSKFLPNLNFKIFIEKQSVVSVINVFNVVVNIFISMIIISFLYLLGSFLFLNGFFLKSNYIGFSIFSGLLNGVFTCYILENKLFKLPEISRLQKTIGYCYFFTTHCYLFYF